MNNEYKMVKKFQVKANQPHPEIPTLLERERVLIRSEWMREEIFEFEGANDLAGQIDAMVDLLYYAIGTLVELGVEPDSFFKIVHEANMKKVDKESSIKRDNDGKVLKPDNWKDPTIIIKKKIEAIISTYKK